jgi:hypothetical protein
MALKIRRGTASQIAGITPAAGELVYATDTDQLFVGDGSTAGGNLIGPASSSGFNLGGNLNLNGNDITGTGNININGTITATGNINLGDTDADNIVIGGEINSNIVPNTDSTFNLGSSGKKWSNGWINTLTSTAITSTTLTGTLTGDVKGSVFGDDSTVLVDGVSGVLRGNHIGNVTGNVTGNVVATDTTVMINATTKSIGYLGAALAGNLTGNVTGNVTGDLRGGSVQTSDGSQTFLYQPGVLGVEAAFVGGVVGDLYGSVFGPDSSTLVNAVDGVINLNGTINDVVLPKTTDANDLGSGVYKFRNLYLSNILNIGSNSSAISSTGSNITLKGNPKANTTLTAVLDGDITGTSINIFTVVDATEIRAGATFKLPGTELLTVDTVNTGTGVITTTTTFTPSAEADDGLSVVFYNPEIFVSVYRHAVPSGQTGEPGDIKGMIFASASYIYVCYADYDGVSNIWARVSTTSW